MENSNINIPGDQSNSTNVNNGSGNETHNMGSFNTDNTQRASPAFIILLISTISNWLLQSLLILIFTKTLFEPIKSTGFGALGVGVGVLIGIPILITATIVSIPLSLYLIKHYKQQEKSVKKVLIKALTIIINLLSILIILIYIVLSVRYLVKNKDKISISSNGKTIQTAKNEAMVDPDQNLVNSLNEITLKIDELSNPIPDKLDGLNLSTTSIDLINAKKITYTANTQAPQVISTSIKPAVGNRPAVTTKTGYYYYQICSNYSQSFDELNNNNLPKADLDGYISSNFFVTSHPSGNVCYKIKGIGALK